MKDGASPPIKAQCFHESCKFNGVQELVVVGLLCRWVVSPGRRQAGGRVPVRGGADKRRQQHPAALPPLRAGREDLPPGQLPRFQERLIYHRFTAAINSAFFSNLT